jgi:hypothetical protein
MTIPQGVLLLYTMNKGSYSQRVYSTTARTFVPIYTSTKPKFQPETPLLNAKFKVDKSL